MVKRCINGHYYDGDRFEMCPHCGAKDIDSGKVKEEPAVERKKTGLQKCSKGHFYDGDKFASCPHCGAMGVDNGADRAGAFSDSREIFSSLENDISENKTIKLEKTGIDLYSNSSVAAAAERDEDPDATVPIVRPSAGIQSIPEPQYTPPVQENKPEPQYTPPVQESKPEPQYMPPVVEDKTEPLVSPMAQNNSEPQFTPPLQNKPEPQYTPPMQNNPEPQFVPKPQYQMPVQPPQPQISYGAAVQNAMNSPVMYNDNPTVSLMNSKFSSEPVVGWLICVNGRYYGESFELKSGKNIIGRAQGADVCLADDDRVSNYNHAVVIYEPREKQFFVQAGDSKELFYKNDQAVLKNESLKAYDILTAGSTKLLFFPLCGEDFSWDDIKEEK